MKMRRVWPLIAMLVTGLVSVAAFSQLQAPVFTRNPIISSIPRELPANTVSWKPELEIYLRGLMEDYRLPGIAVQLVDRKGALVQVTMGYRDLARQIPVTANTVFGIGSTTIAFTGVLMMQLQEAGKLNISDKVRKYRPDFALSEPKYSDEITLRDLMTHSTGVGRHDLAWYHRPGNTRESLFKKIPNLEMSAAPRTEFIYNNWMWMTAGLVAEKASGKSWEALLESQILGPLQMNSTAYTISAVKRQMDYSLPYEVGALGVSEVPFYDMTAMNPAGGIYSNLNDMAKWLRFHLNHGEVDGQVLLSPEGLEETYRGIAPMGGSAKYALGWASTDFAGHRLLTHDGGIDGFASNVSIMPDQGLGVVVLMNASSISPEAIALRIWQHIYGQPLTDFVRENTKILEQDFETSVLMYPDPPKTLLPQTVEEYLGSFCHKAYPPVQAMRGAGQDELIMTLSVLRMTAYPTGLDKFSLRGQYDTRKTISFRRNQSGVVQYVDWKAEPTMHSPIQFERCAGPAK